MIIETVILSKFMKNQRKCEVVELLNSISFEHAFFKNKIKNCFYRKMGYNAKLAEYMIS